MSDIVRFFEGANVKGVNISSVKDLIMILYADDIVMLSSTWMDAQNSLRALNNYCSRNSLTVNAEKSFVVVFQKGGRRLNKKLYYDGKIIKFANKFNYLGLPFSTSAKFYPATEHFLSKFVAAKSTVLNVLRSSKSDNWKSKCYLYESLAESVLLYLSEVWGGPYTEQIERGQLLFFKNLLKLPKNTPSAYVRMEVGRIHSRFTVFKRMIGWWLSLLAMPEDRLPRMCLSRLVQVENNFNLPFNWYSYLKYNLCLTGHQYLLIEDVDTIKNNKFNVLFSFRNYLFSKDVEFILNSSFNPHFRCLSSFDPQGELYLHFNSNIEKIRIFCQLRLCNYKKNFRIIHGHDRYQFFPLAFCKLCNNDKKDDLLHFLYDCKVLDNLRAKFLSKYLLTAYPQTDLLMSNDYKQINDIFCYLSAGLKLRRNLYD